MAAAYSDHDRIDKRSLALHTLVARKVLSNTALLEKARENLRSWPAAGGCPKSALAEWDQNLSGPIEQAARFLVDPSENATRLRQSSPFAGILTQSERMAIFESHAIR